MPRSLRLVFAFALVSVSACGHAAGYPPAVPHPLLNQALPAIRHRQTLGGQPFEAASLAGRPVLVKFFADYCKPCKETLPATERIHQAFPNVVVLGIDEDENASVAASVVERYALTFPVIHDSSNVLSGRFRVATMPMTFVADARGVIRWIGGEGQTESDLRQAVEAAR